MHARHGRKSESPSATTAAIDGTQAENFWGRRRVEPPSPTQPVAARQSIKGGSIVISIFLISLAVPIIFDVGTLRLSPYRVLLILSFVPAIIGWISGKSGKILAADVYVLALCVWSAVAMIVNHGFDFSVQPTGIFLLETFGAYLLARVYIRDAQSFRAMGRTFAYVIIAILPFALYQTITSRPIVLELLGNIFRVVASVYMEPRLGLYRSQGTFEHPILFGVVCTMALPIAYYAVGLGKANGSNMTRTGLVVLATFCSLSAGAFLALAVQLGLVIWGYATRRVANRWQILGGLAVVAFFIVDAISNRSPFEVFISYLTFNQSNSYDRVLIWNYGSQEVLNNPIFGIGFKDWTRPAWMGPSMDNFWLVTAVRYGLPGFILLVLAIADVLKQISVKVVDEEVFACQKALLLMFVGVFFSLATVDLWNASYTLLMFLLGSGTWIADSVKGTSPTQSPGPRHAAKAGRRPASFNSRRHAKRELGFARYST